MKQQLIFTIAAALLLRLNTARAVENTVTAVDNEYQHELVCQAETETENFELILKWKVEYMNIPDGRAPLVKKEFQYELKNLTANSSVQDTYGNFFGEHADIKSTDTSLHAVGQFFMYKRLGYIQKKTDIQLDHDSAGVYSLKSFVNKAADTFENPKDYCNPPTRLCGSVPPLPEPKTVESHIFTNSTCQLVN